MTRKEAQQAFARGERVHYKEWNDGLWISLDADHIGSRAEALSELFSTAKVYMDGWEIYKEPAKGKKTVAIEFKVANNDTWEELDIWDNTDWLLQHVEVGLFNRRSIKITIRGDYKGFVAGAKDD